MVTTKKTSFPSLHSDQGHGLTKVWSKRNKSQNYKRKKEGLNASKSLGERRWEEGGLLEEGFNSQSVDISPKIIFTPKYVRFVINCCESHLRTFCRQIHQSAKIGGRGGRAILSDITGGAPDLQCKFENHCRPGLSRPGRPIVQFTADLDP